MGLAAIDLLQPDEWPVVADAGLVCSMGYPTGRDDFIATGFNDPANHADAAAGAGATIPLAGRGRGAQCHRHVRQPPGAERRRGDQATASPASTRIAPLAEEHRVTVCVELLNSKVDHADYMGDHTAWGVEVMRGVGSPRGASCCTTSITCRSWKAT